PADFRVTGFDDAGVSFLAQPTLTTVRQPVAAMTQTIVEIFRSSFETGGSPPSVVRRFKPSLVIRESSPA
ncbi:MAG: substrate-binding domain-containing protein, partial [Chloroflexota bacterium]